MNCYLIGEVDGDLLFVHYIIVYDMKVIGCLTNYCKIKEKIWEEKEKKKKETKKQTLGQHEKSLFEVKGHSS